MGHEITQGREDEFIGSALTSLPGKGKFLLSRAHLDLERNSLFQGSS